MVDPVCQWFVAQCREVFQLESKYGYAGSEPRRSHAECVWRLNKGGHEILLMVEAIETFSVPTIQFRQRKKLGVYGLHEALPALDPDHDLKRPEGVSYEMTREQFRALLDHWAEFFHAHATQLLEDHEATVKAVKHFRKTKPDPYP